jgi:pimeloyl-ACP methyl ester carboxylesterase
MLTGECVVGGGGYTFEFDDWGLSVQIGLAVVVFWVILEIAFIMVLNYVLLPHLHKLKQPVPYHGDIVHMMKRTLDQVTVLHSYTFKMFVEGFCNAARYEDVCVNNFRSFLSWLMFHKHLTDLDNEEQGKLENIVEYAHKQHPHSHMLKPGFNNSVTHCRMTLEPLPVVHRPLLLYLMANVAEAISYTLFLQGAGFQRFEVDGMKYWYKEQGSRNCSGNSGTCSDGTEPMLFMHGISTGWMLYLPLVKALGSGRTMILLDLDAIKIKSLSFDMPTPERYADRVRKILARHDIARASIVGHSFGSITAGWVVRFLPEKVSHITLIDPVALLLGLPNVAYSFLYRKPSTLIEWIIHLTAARELTISYSLRRHFYWYNNNLWLEDVPAHIGIVVGVSSNDEIISGAAVHEYSNNCRSQRLQLREQYRSDTVAPSTPQVGADVGKNAATTPKRVTRSMSGNKEQASEGGLALQGTTPDDAQTADGCHPVAMIETVLWEGYSHGQILIPTATQRKFVQMVHASEKAGTSG